MEIYELTENQLKAFKALKSAANKCYKLKIGFFNAGKIFILQDYLSHIGEKPDFEDFYSQFKANITYRDMKKREIKFRAWDSDQQQMFQGEIEQFDDMLGFRFEHFGFDPKEDVVYMQFTGLLDKNGIEIYEGDVLISPDFINENFVIGEVDICVVKYNDDLTRFLLTFHSCFGGEGYSGQSEHDQLCRYVSNGYCVKGNIYEQFKDYI